MFDASRLAHSSASRFERGVRPCLVAGAAALCLAGTAGAAKAIDLAPHRAVYELEMTKSEGRNAPASARGQIVFEITGNACEGYSVNFRQYTEIAPQEGSPRISDMRTATFEAADGSWMRFRITTSTNGVTTKVLEGRADKDKGNGLSVSLSKPAPRKSDLGHKVVFPVEQTRKTIAAAKAGQVAVEVKTYDGSEDGNKIYHSLSIVGKARKTPANDLTGGVEAMANMKRWPVVASYFELDKRDATPLYTMSFDLWENGVTSNLKVDYGSFVLTGKMTKLEMLKPQPCPAPEGKKL